MIAHKAHDCESRLSLCVETVAQIISPATFRRIHLFFKSLFKTTIFPWSYNPLYCHEINLHFYTIYGQHLFFKSHSVYIVLVPLYVFRWRWSLPFLRWIYITFPCMRDSQESMHGWNNNVCIIISLLSSWWLFTRLKLYRSCIYLSITQTFCYISLQSSHRKWNCKRSFFSSSGIRRLSC